MRVVIHLENAEPDNDEYEPPELPGIESEYYRGGGNIHVTDESVEQIADTVAGNVIIWKDENKYGIQNASVSSVYPNE